MKLIWTGNKRDLYEMKDQNKIMSPGFLKWIAKHKCASCKEEISFNNYLSVGFGLNGKDAGVLCVDFICSGCEERGKIRFKGEEFSLERLCSLVILHSDLMDDERKKEWNKKYIDKKEI